MVAHLRQKRLAQNRCVAARILAVDLHFIVVIVDGDGSILIKASQGPPQLVRGNLDGEPAVECDSQGAVKRACLGGIHEPGLQIEQAV